MSINKDSQKAPNLRFKGFTDDWEERKLRDLFIKGRSGGTPKSTNKDFYEGNIPFLGISDITKSNGFINNTEKHISVDGLNNSAAWVVPRGAISLAMYASVGKLAILNIDAATSQAFYNMVFDDDDLRDLVYQCLIKANELSEWNKLISTGTQANLNADKVKNFKLYLPQNYAEIKLISAFLKHFDTTITLQQRKLDQLKQLKEALLQQMFPGKGETVPKLRFVGFEGDWEERKLGELSNVVGGGTPSTSNPEYWDGDIDWYAPAEIGKQSYVSKSKKTITELGLKKSSARILPVGTVLFTSRAGIGNTAILAKEATTNQGFQSIVPDQNKLDSYFIFSRTNELKRYGEVTGSGSTFVEVSGKQMSKMPIMVPVLSEQQRIGLFFKQLDETIALQQRKLEQLQDIKQVLLQNMFI
ncbi:restriction endonuclease subunit S [Aerococcus suis]